MSTVIQFRHREVLGGGTGAPASAGLTGEIVINYDTGSDQPELWSYNGSDWVLLNTKESITTEYITLSGGTPGTPTGIGAAWTAYTPKPTTDFVVALYGLTAYLKSGDGAADGDWTALIPNDVLSPAVVAAQASADAASVSESAARDSEAAAEASATTAAASMSKASEWAQQSEDVEVEPGLFSAYHWAKKAEDIVISAGNPIQSIVGTPGEINIDDVTDPLNPVISIDPSFSPDARTYKLSFTNLDLVGGDLLVTHSLDSEFVSVVNVWDQNNRIVSPDEVQSTGSDTLTIELGSFGAISGSWNLSIIA